MNKHIKSLIEPEQILNAELQDAFYMGLNNWNEFEFLEELPRKIKSILDKLRVQK